MSFTSQRTLLLWPWVLQAVVIHTDKMEVYLFWNDGFEARWKNSLGWRFKFIQENMSQLVSIQYECAARYIVRISFFALVYFLDCPMDIRIWTLLVCCASNNLDWY